ncbi:hypothetical protein GCM10008012_20710 [Rhizobium anhuiense]|nr:hypothetical protein GCM10008012_20710 [Rhizobium anhuiense]
MRLSLRQRNGNLAADIAPVDGQPAPVRVRAEMVIPPPDSWVSGRPMSADRRLQAG